ncbi:hypothetical protein SBDP2_1890004 [Syntrophobacter sp. SbD2]|nr:hypothetical protein SBDP2_1890004 [Syntrophobacter sp. SbD2]
MEVVYIVKPRDLKSDLGYVEQAADIRNQIGEETGGLLPDSAESICLMRDGRDEQILLSNAQANRPATPARKTDSAQSEKLTLHIRKYIHISGTALRSDAGMQGFEAAGNMKGT